MGKENYLMNSYNADQFLQLETRVWAALYDGDALADSQLLADDFLGVYRSGFTGKAEHVSQLRDGPTVASYRLSNARIQVLSEDIVLLSYCAQWSRRKDDVVGDVESMYVTSIWRRLGGIWKNVFSQDTPV